MSILHAHLADDDSTRQMLGILHRIRNIQIKNEVDDTLASAAEQKTLIHQLSALSSILLTAKYSREAEALESVHSLSCLGTDFGGLGFCPEDDLGPKEEAQVLFLVSAWLESLNSADRSKTPNKMLSCRPKGRRGMTMCEKIFASHDVERRGELKPGDMVRVDVDWVMASELSWGGMKSTYDSLGKPGIFRNDRFWLAGDHVVDPRLQDNPLIKRLVAASEKARDDFMMTEYQGMNYTIMHTEFFRERAEPGMLIIGSDSHTCSAGSLGCLAIGLGVADVTIPLITGETWFKVPESVNIQFVGRPSPGIGGKDVVLYVMKELKRNTVASDRIVEYTGPGLKYLSCDARFAIANMTTEFGGITGIFTPDQETHDFIAQRKSPRHKKNSIYFAPDEDATYVEAHIINLDNVEPFIARYPSPDDVVPIGEIEGTCLDGCFIGACTTAEEDLILAGMLLKVGLQKGLRPTKVGKRKVVPGSLPILRRLKMLGLVDMYEEAGFKVGVPGCSYCVGMSADAAGEGEVWLSSQNRNFKNRMGTGSIANLASAASVAASSFDMKITSPNALLRELDFDSFDELLGRKPHIQKAITYVEPCGEMLADNTPTAPEPRAPAPTGTTPTKEILADSITPLLHESSENSRSSDIISGRIQCLGDFIDTDALAPSGSLTECKNNEEFGEYCLKHTHPDFRARARAGDNIVVAGTAFGCGSSRENAVSALLGVGIQCVIAKSFAFIYGRNQPNLGLLGISISDPDFYAAAEDGAEIEIELTERKVRIRDREWPFELSHMERELIKAGGISRAFETFGKKLFSVMCTAPTPVRSQKIDCGTSNDLQW